MLWLRVCLAVCIPIAVGNVLAMTMTGLRGTLKWSSLNQCTGSGTIPNGPTWQYSGDDTGSTLTVSGTGAYFPEVGEGQYWKEDAICYPAITTVTVSDGLLVIGPRAFSDLPNLRTVTGNTVQRIHDYAFANSGVTNQILSGLRNLQYVGIRSLQNTKNLGEVSVEGSITVDDYALEGSGVTWISLRGSPIRVNKGVLKDCVSLSHFSLSGMAAVPDSFFEGCVSLSFFSMEGIQVIGSRAFYGCSRLSGTFLSTDVLEGIGASAFESSGLLHVDIRAHATEFLIKEAAFKNCVELNTVWWSEKYSFMPDSIFEGCISMNGPNIPANVRVFGEACFRNCKTMKYITYKGHAQAPASIFEGCDSLLRVFVPDNYEYDNFGGFPIEKDEGLMCKEKIAIVIGVFVIVIIALVVVMVLIITGIIRCRKRDTD